MIARYARKVVSWNAMIVAEWAHFYEAPMLFQKMQLEDMKTNSDTFVSVLQACANFVDLWKGSP